MQVFSARLGVVTGKDLAQGCRDWYPKWTRWPNWLLCEFAIGACDLAEVLGSAVALNLLFHIPLLWAVIITASDVLLLLALQRFGMRMIEAVVLVLVAHDRRLLLHRNLRAAADRSPVFGRWAHALAHAGLSPAGDGLCGDRHHRRDRHAAQSLPAFGAGAEPQAARKMSTPCRSAIQFNTIDSVGGAGGRILRQRGDPGSGGDGVLRQRQRHRAKRTSRAFQARQPTGFASPTSRSLRCWARRRRASCLPWRCWPAARAAPSPARWPGRW